MSVNHKKAGAGQGGGVDPGAIEAIEKSIAAVQESADAVKQAVEETATATEKAIEGMQAAGDKTAAFLSVAFQAQIAADRAGGTNSITDDVILQAAEVMDFPEWKVNTPYKKGAIIKSGALLFEVVAAHTSNAAYPVETTFAYYRLIELAHTGTREDPIPYPETAGIVVNVKNGLYYSYKGAVYLAKADMPSCVYPPGTAGLWQWEKVK